MNILIFHALFTEINLIQGDGYMSILGAIDLPILLVIEPIYANLFTLFKLTLSILVYFYLLTSLLTPVQPFFMFCVVFNKPEMTLAILYGF